MTMQYSDKTVFNKVFEELLWQFFLYRLARSIPSPEYPSYEIEQQFVQSTRRNLLSFINTANAKLDRFDLYIESTMQTLDLYQTHRLEGSAYHTRLGYVVFSPIQPMGVGAGVRIFDIPHEDFMEFQRVAHTFFTSPSELRPNFLKYIWIQTLDTDSKSFGVLRRFNMTAVSKDFDYYSVLGSMAKKVKKR